MKGQNESESVKVKKVESASKEEGKSKEEAKEEPKVDEKIETVATKEVVKGMESLKFWLRKTWFNFFD